MSRIESLSILLEDEGKDFLREEYGKVIENVAKSTISGKIKNTDLSGDPTSGSVEAKRFANAKSQKYGTARGNGKGNNIKAAPVNVPIDQDKEFVEEIEQKDCSMYGVEGVVKRRIANHGERLYAELDEEFFKVAADSGSVMTSNKTDIVDIIDDAVNTLVKTKNDYIDGIDRSLISVTCDVDTYSDVRKFIDKLPNSNVSSDKEDFYGRHGVKYFEEVRLPDDVLAIVMMDGSIAQPVTFSQPDAERVPLSDAIATELFFYYGTKAVTPETILIIKKEVTGQ